MLMMAKAFPNSEFIGFDFHPDSIRDARQHAEEHGAAGNIRFGVSSAKDYPGEGYDLYAASTLVCVFAA